MLQRMVAPWIILAKPSVGYCLRPVESQLPHDATVQVRNSMEAIRQRARTDAAPSSSNQSEAFQCLSVPHHTYK